MASASCGADFERRPASSVPLNQRVVRMTSGVVRDIEWRMVASAHSATIAPVNVASAASPPLASATIPATSVTPPRTEASTT